MTDDSLAWARPARCNATTECAEVAVDGDEVAIRSSREPGIVIRYTRDEFRSLSAAIKDGEFDHLI